MADVFELHEGSSPLIINFPHSGTYVPDDILERFTARARELPDTDWFVDRLYAFASELDATFLKANASRFVIDLNRDPSGQSLYPGQATTGLVPTELFDGEPIYAGEPPDEAEIEQRRLNWFAPYHAELARQIERVKAQHGYVVLYDAHSIATRVPRLFDGELPALNLGTNSGQSCHSAIERSVSGVMAANENFSSIVNGRFKGGWITRHYGQPDKTIHALQMELAQSAYMDEAACKYDATRAAPLQELLSRILVTALDEAKRLNWDRTP